MKNLNETPETITISGKTVSVLSFFGHNRVLDIHESQQKVFKHFGLTINTYFEEGISHANFMNYCLKNFESDIFIFIDLDCVPLDDRIYKNIVNELISEECIIGIEQTANHKDPNFIYAGPACFGITKEVYNKFGGVSFDGTHRSDVAQEYTYISYENNITVKFIELISSRN